MHLLLVEDDRRLAKVMKRVLEDERHVVDCASDGSEGFELGLTGTFDVIVLDLMLPGTDGIEVCRRLRAARVVTPVLMLTARDAIDDRVMGLDAGADDYLPKPFAFAELLARIRALCRRRAQVVPEVLTVGDLSLDTSRRAVSRAGKELDLTPKEFALLEFFMRHPGQVLTRHQILDHVWGYGFADAGPDSVNLYVHYLRKKVDNGSERKLIGTVRAVGYRMSDRES
jgi:DNA-binding response OmpR family regulator